MKRWIVGLAVVVVLVGVGHVQASVIIHRTFTTPVGQAGALAWTGSSFYSTDGTTIYEYDLDGNELSSFSSPGSPTTTLERGLAFDGTYLWLYDRYQFSPPSMFYKLDTSGNVITSFAAPGGALNIFGLTWDGTYLLGTNFSGNTIAKIDVSGNLVGTINTNAHTLGGLGFDGTSLVAFDFNYPVGPLNQAMVRIDPATGIVTGVIAREFGGTYPYHVFAHLANDRWLLRKGFGSTSADFAEATLLWTPVSPDGDIIPEPSSLAIWSLLGLTFPGIGWYRRRRGT